MIDILTPKTVFVPFEWLSGKDWRKRDDLPRFRDIELIAPYFQTHQEKMFRNGKPVPVVWIECDQPHFVHEYLQGVGTPEWLLLHGKTP